ncbi:MAG: TM0106 family RecB-like putative nuclease [Candidatus Saccharimonadales bacterium]
MQPVDDRLLLSASDLAAFMECEHLSALDLRVAYGTETIEPSRNDAALLVARKGDEHEAAYLARLRAEKVDVAVLPAAADSLGDLDEAVEHTKEAMRSGAEVIYQGALLDGDWRGYADFLERVAAPSPAFGDYSYEVLDTKLARTTRPRFLVQLCLYSELLARVQGRWPEWMHVVSGSGERYSFRVDEFSAFYRRLRRRYEDQLAVALPDTYPQPVAHCELCRYSEHCRGSWEADDHLSLIAGIGRAQVVRLAEAGIATCAELAVVAPAARPRRIGTGAFERLREQARLQVHERSTGEQVYGLLLPEEERGFARLPEPREGDLFFDMEGDPFYEGDGLEYLFGVTRGEDGAPVFHAFWARDRREEKAAFEAFIDFVMDAMSADPKIHVYHYAPYEPTALKRLMGRHGTREDEVDALLRGQVLVDLYTVTRQALRLSKPSYSIKQVEAFYMDARGEQVTDAGDSILRFEEWLETGDETLLESIEAYNQADCLSTLKLHGWLLERRAEAERTFAAAIPWRAPPEPYVPSPEAAEAQDETAQLADALTRNLDESPDAMGTDDRGRWLMAQLLNYHRREDKPVWWAYFERLQMSGDELVEDAEAIGQITLEAHQEPLADKKSYIYTLRFPEQEHKLLPGAEAIDAASERSVNVVEIDDTNGIVRVRRAQSRDGEALPTGLIPCGPYNTVEQRAALRRLADTILTSGIDRPGPLRVLRDVLLRMPPRITGVAGGAALQDGSPDIEQLARLAERLDDSYLFIQGPPGSGKTWTGAQLATRLLHGGARVGIAAMSHKAIHNLLHEIEETAVEQQLSFQGWKKSSAGNLESEYHSKLERPFITNEPDQQAFPPDDAQLLAGTAWLFSPESMDGTLDYLIIDEAGQVSLADALAMGTAARNLILLGDPLQLAQVSGGVHPDGTGASVLEHLLGEHGTIPPERGIFLDQTRRMHPDVCRFVSEVVYESRLHAIPECSNQRIHATGALAGTGVRFIEVHHEGNTRASPEEADAITGAIAGLASATITESDGTQRPLAMNDIMVVTPYNAQVRCLADRLPGGVRIGTVDKFQGQEAHIVFFSMATSSGAEVPRNVEFLYSRNRLNVAVSRARSLAVLVCNPELLHIDCRTVEQMRLVNALCRFIELARPPTGTSASEAGHDV